VHAAVCTAPADTKLKLVVHKMRQGFIIDTIATSTIDISAVKKIDDIYMIPFGRFSMINSDEGISYDVSYLEISDQIALELTGFNKEGVELSVLSQKFGTAPANENNALVWFLTGDDRVLDRYPDNTSLLFSMNATYPFLFTNDGDVTFSAPGEGGTKSFDITSLYHPADFWTENLPDWVNLGYRIDENTWDIKLDFTVAPLPSEIEGRSVNLKLRAPGSELIFKISQGTVGISESETGNVKVLNTANGFELTYPADFKSVTVYNISGQIVANYSLVPEGQFTIPTDQLLKGIYILKLDGTVSKSIKVVK
jgi:hypothetical protein